MSIRFTPTRRDFIRTVGAAGVTLIVNRITPASAASAAPTAPTIPKAEPSVPPEWAAGDGKARYRIDGIPKVRGDKIYARDYRARDMEGWPATERMALVLRTTRVDRRFKGIDLSILPVELMPQKIVTSDDLANDAITLPSSTTAPDGTKVLLADPGQPPVYYGQPAAILIFKDFETWRQASRTLQFREDDVILYYPGAPHAGATPPQDGGRTPVSRPDPILHQPAPYQPATHLTRYADKGVERFSQVKDGYSNPYQFTTDPPDQATNKVNREARRWRRRVSAEFEKSGVKVFEGTFHTQVIDPMFLEPEAGLAWFDRSATEGGTAGGATGGTMNLVLGTQSTNGDFSTTLALFAAEDCPFKVATVVLNSCYPGGGFGGRDVSIMPLLLSIAAAYSDGPVRIAQDRYQQFQSGLKQLGARLHPRLAVDAEGRFTALEYRLDLLAGGNNNYSQWVAQLAAYCAAGGYDITKVWVDGLAVPTTGVVAGSMRGFGGPQAFFAIECLIDEAAAALKIDPIKLRRINALAKGDHTVTGAPLNQKMPLAEICDIAARQALWRDRDAVRKEKAKSKRGPLYGVGFALANQAYGTGGDGVMAEVFIDASGLIGVRTNCVDMGNGSATSLAISTARSLGANAREVITGDVVSFDALGMNSASGGSWSDPRWTSSMSMSSSACLTAFHQVHACEQAAAALFDTGLYPAACRIWTAGGGKAPDKKATVWKDGALRAPGSPPLPLAQIAAEIFAGGLVASAMVHAFYQGQWVAAKYTVDGVTAERPIDGFSTRLAAATGWRIHDRQEVKAPPASNALWGRSLYAPAGALAAVEIDRATGAVRVVEIHTILDAGRVIQPDLLTGQSQGGVAMGIGYALLEKLPLTEGGAGSGRWNLDRYRVAKAGDVPMDRLKLTLLPPEGDTAKGIAEAVLCPIAPAIVNAISHATGKRFDSLPVLAEDIRKVLA